MKSQPLNHNESHAEQDARTLRAGLIVREILHHARYDAQQSEIASLRRRLEERDAQLRALRRDLRERTRYLYVSIALLGMMLVTAWV